MYIECFKAGQEIWAIKSRSQILFTGEDGTISITEFLSFCSIAAFYSLFYMSFATSLYEAHVASQRMKPVEEETKVEGRLLPKVHQMCPNLHYIDANAAISVFH